MLSTRGRGGKRVGRGLVVEGWESNSMPSRRSVCTGSSEAQGRFLDVKQGRNLRWGVSACDEQGVSVWRCSSTVSVYVYVSGACMCYVCSRDPAKKCKGLLAVVDVVAGKGQRQRQRGTALSGAGAGVSKCTGSSSTPGQDSGDGPPSEAMPTSEDWLPSLLHTIPAWAWSSAWVGWVRGRGSPFQASVFACLALGLIARPIAHGAVGTFLGGWPCASQGGVGRLGGRPAG